jgi:LuxR family maltose regulon positive regulatory protein
MWLEVPAITQARVLIAAGDEESLRKATELLKAIRHESDTYRFANQTIETMVLQALTLEKQGHTDEALATLQEAVTLAEPGGWIRPFVEAGPLMADLLNQLRQQDVAPDYIDQILDAFPKKNEDVPPILSKVEEMKEGSKPGQVHPSALSPQPLIEPLSNRELEVLELLAQRLSDKEIGQELVISTQTVKKHNARIFQKLNVKNRREAVAEASALGILPNG